ncbi:hypothetical protein L218DRAFT_1079644 [Marasmius fiardii PR-910]|nr:hypothetical protein L218DRAFT_1079644 [Marasmius fiardii PR-910]
MPQNLSLTAVNHSLMMRAIALGSLDEPKQLHSPPSQQPSLPAFIAKEDSSHKIQTSVRFERLGDGGKLYERDRDTLDASVCFWCVSLPIRVGPDLQYDISAPTLEHSRRLNTQHKNDRLEKSRPNALTAIFCLPDEILIKIFAYCLSYEPYKDSWIDLAISHVCRDWRSVALETPTLWSCPDFRVPKLAREMLTRSKMAPLDIVWKTKGSTSENNQLAIYEAFSHISRFVSLSLTTAINLQYLIEDPNLVKSAPLLQSLYLEDLSESLGEGGHRVVGGAFFLPTSFLGNDAPHLKHFVVKGPCVSWESSLLRQNLTTLIIRHSRPIPGYLPKCDYFLQILECMPSLEELQLDHAVPKRPTKFIPSSDQRTVSLPHLRRVTLSSAPAADLCYLLDSIAFPSHAHLRFVLGSPANHVFLIPEGSESETENEFSRLISSLRKLFSHANPTELFTSLRVASNMVFVWGCRCNESPVQCLGRCPSTYSFLWIVFERYHRSPSRLVWWYNLLRRVWSTLPIEGIRWLEFGGIHVEKEPSVVFRNVEVFTVLGRLFKISVSQLNCAHAVVELLKTAIQGSIANEFGKFTEPGLPSDAHALAFPALRELEFYQVPFDGTFFNVFRDVLMVRSEYGCEIWSIRLVDCDKASDEMVRLLREVVVDVSVVRW